MVRIGVTGGIASGKTLVADELAGLGAIVIDADVLARQVVQPGTTGLAEIVLRFGSEVLQPDGSLDRARLGDVVFRDDRARADLNAIVHPRVRAEATRLEEASPAGAVVVHVIPLLVETGQQNSFDGVIVVDVPEETQVERLMRRNGLTRQQAHDRLNSQVSRQERLAAADWVVDNAGAPERTRRLVGDLWDGALANLRKAVSGD
ncbi:dephospho-CoA kinase [Tessaracoccus antarcticus]|uniref:Dephospho-CoA kinase n=1 Tax=Tessaracoccus antarcticus TaxID=2479848 RepID=A0A3M0GQZ9_9ACTN|nr:dephospho-CoA kinase [Tessaracoccus antarcticus]RMB59706.1 dephospho-CoA kinase [Tessaracoccus antarcticus]